MRDDEMNGKSAYKNAIVLAAISLTLLLDACVCRPVRVGMSDAGTPSTIAELKASLQ
jgi:hypothetical protein